MKKILLFLLTGLMVFAFCACKNGSTNETVTDSDFESEENYDEEYDEYYDDEYYDDEYYDDEYYDDDVVKEMNIVYSEDDIRVTLYKPDDAYFTIGSDTPEDAGDIAGLSAEDFSWDAEIMGYTCYHSGIEGTRPFVDFYYLGKVLNEDVEMFNGEVTELDFDFEGGPVVIIRYSFKEDGDEEIYEECFVGFEYSDEKGLGLMGLKIGAFDEELSDSYLENLFCEVFCPER